MLETGWVGSEPVKSMRALGSGDVRLFPMARANTSTWWGDQTEMGREWCREKVNARCVVKAARQMVICHTT